MRDKGDAKLLKLNNPLLLTSGIVQTGWVYMAFSTTKCNKSNKKRIGQDSVDTGLFPRTFER